MILIIVTVLIIFNEAICKLIIKIFQINTESLHFYNVVSGYDRVLYFLLFGYFILSLLYVIYSEKKNISNFLHKIFPGFICLVSPFLFQIIILRYQYLFRWEDAGHYVSIGMNLFSGYGPSSSISGTLGAVCWPYMPFPIYQFCHYLFSIFFGLFWEIFHSLKGVMLSIVILESVNCLLIYKISRKIFKSTFYSIGMSFLYFSIVLYIIPLRESLQPLYDIPFSTIVFLLLYFIGEEFVTLKKALFLGLFLGIGVLVKSTSFFVLIVFILSILFYFSKSIKIRLKTSLFATLGFLLFLIPYQIYCLQFTGELFPSNYTSSFYSFSYILRNNKAGKIIFYDKKEKNSVLKEEKTSIYIFGKEAPLVKSPRGDKVVGLRPTFYWSKFKGALNYEIEITTDGGKKIDEFYSDEINLKLKTDLPPTRLRWHVRGRRNEETGIWSSWAYFTPKKIKIINLFYSRASLYFIIMAFSILFFVLYNALNKKALINFRIFYSTIFIMIYSLIMFSTRANNENPLKERY